MIKIIEHLHIINLKLLETVILKINQFHHFVPHYDFPSNQYLTG